MPIRIRARRVGPTDAGYKKGETYDLWLNNNEIMRLDTAGLLVYMHTQHFLTEWTILEVIR